MKTHLPAVVLVSLSLLFFACGANVERGAAQDKSNFRQEDFKAPAQPVTVTVQPPVEEVKGPKDPDGLLHRISADLYPYLAEVRVHQETDVMVIFKGGEAIQLKPADLPDLQLAAVGGGQLVVRVRSQEFQLTAP
ncbi:MAG: hypothetical protein RBU37_07935 [Myxococcota bacterium]|nr:hypothetical protein [Myxococcota bacterium]